MIPAFRDIPQLIGNEDYFQNVPVYIGRNVFSTPGSEEQGLASLHQHQFIEISYVEKGNGFHRIWNESYPAAPGDLYVLNVAVPHGFFPLTEADMLHVRSLYLDLNNFYKDEIIDIGNEKYLFGLFAQNNFAVHLRLKPKQIKSIFSDLCLIQMEILKQQTDWQDALYSRVTLLLLDIKRMVMNSKEKQLYNEIECTPVIASVLRMVRENYADPAFSLKSVSETLHRSPSSISRNFNKVTGKHFSDYLTCYRLQQAISLLTKTELSNEEIAIQCGYRDLSFFYRQFKEIIGVTPGERRKRARHEYQQKTAVIPYYVNSHAIYDTICENLQHCKKKTVIDLVIQALEKGLPPNDIIQYGLVRAMNIIGTKFQANEVFLLEVVGVSKILNRCMEILRPYMVKSDSCYLGRAVICTVKGDLHDIGKNLVKAFMEAKGIQCIDLGVDVDPEAVTEAVRKHNAQLVCLSALLSTTMMEQKKVIDALTEAGLRDTVRVMVGGGMVTQDFADYIGADCYTPDAVSAANAAVRLLCEMKEQK
ncbi:MAG: helix-turn-helix domain-containing protein [Ruminococcaceae bacterium]|nr:helix-turn-helix domain-containing protein [Oscillospiraceae bacterium]